VGMDDETRHLIDASSSDGITVYRINSQKLPIRIVETYSDLRNVSLNFLVMTALKAGNIVRRSRKKKGVSQRRVCRFRQLISFCHNSMEKLALCTVKH